MALPLHAAGVVALRPHGGRSGHGPGERDPRVLARRERDDDVAFVHQEIYNENQIDKGQRPSVAAFGLPTEPWLFVVGADGRVAARFEGAFSAEELNKAIDSAVGKS